MIDYENQISELKKKNYELECTVTHLGLGSDCLQKQIDEVKANADYQIEGRELEIKKLKERIEKMKFDVMGNIKWADQNKNNQMWQKLVKMWNQWQEKWENKGE